MFSDDILYRVALTLIPGIGAVQAKILLQHFDAPGIFKAKKHWLEKIEGIGSIKADQIKNFHGFNLAENEIRFIEKNNIRPLFITDADYPKRLLHCYDSPTLLYYRGSTDLNAVKLVAVIGTRENTAYGKQVTEKLINELTDQKVTIVSGLAFGIDAIAHRSAIKNDLPTIGVLAHGLHTLYPYEHHSLAKEMIKNGGLLTEFNSQVKPDKHNFPIRNRIVAGMCDATIVIETGIKGGSMITCELANGYNREVFAFPGRTIDNKSAGCNHLIRNNKAVLITEANELVQLMGWEDDAKGSKERKRQRELFIDLTADEKIIVDLLREKELTPIDEINARSGMTPGSVAGVILNLELQGVITSRPGKLYTLN